MTTQEIKSEIKKVIDNFPENILIEVLEYLRHVQKANLKDLEMSIHLGQILREDKELLKRLAQ